MVGWELILAYVYGGGPKIWVFAYIIYGCSLRCTIMSKNRRCLNHEILSFLWLIKIMKSEILFLEYIKIQLTKSIPLAYLLDIPKISLFASKSLLLKFSNYSTILLCFFNWSTYPLCVVHFHQVFTHYKLDLPRMFQLTNCNF